MELKKLYTKMVWLAKETHPGIKRAGVGQLLNDCSAMTYFKGCMYSSLCESS